MPVVEVSGLRLAYERRGRGDAVVLVHGYVGDGRSTWGPQLDALSDEFDIIALDLPGAGESDDPPEDFGMAGFADALAGFITEIGVSRPHVVGLSFGGATVIEFCRRYQDLARSIVLVGAYAGWGGSLAPVEVERRLAQALQLSTMEPEELVNALLPTMFAASAPPSAVDDYRQALAAFHPAGLRSMARACAEDLTEVASSISLPTLLVYGQEDTRAPAGVADDLCQAISGSRLVQLAGAGHVCNVDAVDEFNDTVRHFLRQHASPPAG